MSGLGSVIVEAEDDGEAASVLGIIAQLRFEADGDYVIHADWLSLSQRGRHVAKQGGQRLILVSLGKTDGEVLAVVCVNHGCDAATRAKPRAAPPAHRHDLRQIRALGVLGWHRRRA